MNRWLIHPPSFDPERVPRLRVGARPRRSNDRRADGARAWPWTGRLPSADRGTAANRLQSGPRCCHGRCSVRAVTNAPKNRVHSLLLVAAGLVAGGPLPAAPAGGIRVAAPPPPL